MKTFTKYTLIQIPGWALGAFILYWFWSWSWMTYWPAIGFFLLWVAKDFIIYPFVRIGYETNTKSVVEHLVGMRGIAKEHLNPKGYVEVRAELWEAEIEPGGKPIFPGSPIQVTGVKGRRLIVLNDAPQ